MEQCRIIGCFNNACGLGLCLDHYIEYRDKNRYKKGEPIKKHGMRKTKEYKAWSNMKSRCYRKNDVSFKDYGGRGIRVCDEWINDFMRFYLDMGPMPMEGMQVDRINNEDNYSKENCKWVTAKENDRHKRGLRLNAHKAAIIKAMLKMGISKRDIASMTGVTRINIAHVARGGAWDDIVPDEKETYIARIIASERGVSLIEELGNE